VCIREPVLKLEDSRSIRCNSRICHTCVRFLEELCIELWSVINFHCEIEPANLLQYYLSLICNYSELLWES
jgi:hypothetical protein